MTSMNRTHTDHTNPGNQTDQTDQTNRTNQRPRPGRLRRWRLAVVPVALLAPVGLVACGGSNDASASPTTTTAQNGN